MLGGCDNHYTTETADESQFFGHDEASGDELVWAKEGVATVIRKVDRPREVPMEVDVGRLSSGAVAQVVERSLSM